ncbi:EmrB/QacA family drug resistance transporter [Pseudooceanicola nanhaiensis]|jgi:DHA2 family multidrug resistance protein|uniref:EmrB/QacA family drug resistance transporter n=1 Tax=Pseudooceanicola nanhaiensis TaxID=375761 RepID=A0A917WBF1_9RHOB|nr:DHA2 family efflux MFS transporter permease subunit [Pseudooceanicola nanhaiensis]GGL91299.1 EmrB/QacA family drug resistance transporter [Pseudooceanicola nanhaiensis]
MTQTLSAPKLSVAAPGLLTVSIMIATVMQVLDTTIANVALPHMAASLNATQEEITWVLTSYIVASAIATPLTGFAADRLGRRRVFTTSIAGFVATSVLCGIASSLPEMVIFRILQGVFGAALIPLAQSVLLDINPREKIGQAMAIYGAGIMVGPIVGPTLGGYLTEVFNWRYVFFINLPVGLLAFLGVAAFMPAEDTKQRRFDMMGFAMLALAVGSLQLMLDRGQSAGWFASVEIWLYLGLTISGLWAFVIHCWGAREPFVELSMFRDRNFVMGLVFIFIIGMTLFSGLALLPPLLQKLMGYPVISTGLVMAPRGVGTMVSMILVGRLVARFDPRGLVLFGLICTAWSLHMMTGFESGMDSTPIIVSGVLQGFGLGFVFVPLSTLTFATLANRFRGDATAMFSLVRNVGSGVGISMVTVVLAHMSTVNHEEIASTLTAQSGAVQHLMPQLIAGSQTYAAIVDGLVSQQAAMVAYIDNFFLMMILTVATIPIVLLLRRPG